MRPLALAFLAAALSACITEPPRPAHSDRDASTDEDRYWAAAASSASAAPAASVPVAAPSESERLNAEARAELEENQARQKARQDKERVESELIDRECADEQASAAAAAAPGVPSADDDKASHVAWVHDHCSAHQPPPVVTCNPVCVARRACFVWDCGEHPDWAEEVSIYDCDPHRGAHAISVHAGVCAARRHQDMGPRGGSFRD